jgi:Protein of unknown function (DUF3558)
MKLIDSTGLRRSFLQVLALVAFAGAMSGCTETATGQPVAQQIDSPAGSNNPFPTGSEAPVTSSSAEPGVPASPMKDVSPCSLLSAVEVADLGAGQSKEETINGARVCGFDNGQGFAMSVGIWDDLGLDDLVADDLKPVQMIGNHRARQGTAPLGGGVVAIEVTRTSRVDVTASSVDGDKQKSYELAMRVAKLVEPKLPR